MIPLAAYCDRLSIRPGETIRFHCANATGQPVTAAIVRVSCADPNPAGPGIVTEPVNCAVRELAAPAPQSVLHGSYMATPPLPPDLLGDAFSFYCRLQPTLRQNGDQFVACLAASDGTPLLRLGMDAGGTLFGEFPGRVRVCLDVALRIGFWSQVWLSVDAAHGLRIGCAPVPGSLWNAGRSAEAGVDARHPGTLDGPLLVAAGGTGAQAGHFNGRIESPALYPRALDAADLQMIAAGEMPRAPAACWDFGQNFAGATIPDTGTHALHATTVNGPVRAVCASTWRATHMCFSQAHSSMRRRTSTTTTSTTAAGQQPMSGPSPRISPPPVTPWCCEPAIIRRTCPSSWWRRKTVPALDSPCWCPPSPIPSTETRSAATGSGPSGARPGTDRSPTGMPIRTTRGIIRSTACPPTTATRTRQWHLHRLLAPADVQRPRGLRDLRPRRHSRLGTASLPRGFPPADLAGTAGRPTTSW